MKTTIDVPLSFVESVSQLELSPKMSTRLQELIGYENERDLTARGYEELRMLVEMRESLSRVRAEALRLLGRKPQ